MITIAMIRRSVAFMAVVMSLDSSSAFSSVKMQRRHRLIYLSTPQHLPTSLMISMNRHRPFSLFLKDDNKPHYENIHGPLGKTMDDIFLTEFRIKMAEKFGFDSQRPKNDYQGLMELAVALNSRYSNKAEMQYLAQEVLRSLFPSWLPKTFAWMFAKPFPEFSSRLNAWATSMVGIWLMGECEINDYEMDGGGVAHRQGLLVKRCRFLEESGCASICVNACKIPTQRFFSEDMGLSLTMTPDYDSGECQFSFGRIPTIEEELKAKNTPCLSRCPSSSIRISSVPSETEIGTRQQATDVGLCNEMD